MPIDEIIRNINEIIHSKDVVVDTAKHLVMAGLPTGLLYSYLSGSKISDTICNGNETKLALLSAAVVNTVLGVKELIDYYVGGNIKGFETGDVASNIMGSGLVAGMILLSNYFKCRTHSH